MKNCTPAYKKAAPKAVSKKAPTKMKVKKTYSTKSAK